MERREEGICLVTSRWFTRWPISGMCLSRPQAVERHLKFGFVAGAAWISRSNRCFRHVYMPSVPCQTAPSGPSRPLTRRLLLFRLRWIGTAVLGARLVFLQTFRAARIGRRSSVGVHSRSRLNARSSAGRIRAHRPVGPHRDQTARIVNHYGEIHILEEISLPTPQTYMSFDRE